MAVRERPSSASSLEGAAHLIGELGADGTASLQRVDDANLNGNAPRPQSYSQDSSVSSSSSSQEEASIHGELDGLVPESAVAASETAVLLRSKHHQAGSTHTRGGDDELDEVRSRRRRKSLTVRLEKTGQAGRYQLTAEDPELRNLLKEGFERSKDGGIKKKRSRFRDLVFTRQFTAFDRQNAASASSPFHGFFSLFWSVPWWG
jgi:sterol O-acyltransferase